jgi:hypothetical protein
MVGTGVEPPSSSVSGRRCRSRAAGRDHMTARVARPRCPHRRRASYRALGWRWGGIPAESPTARWLSTCREAGSLDAGLAERWRGDRGPRVGCRRWRGRRLRGRRWGCRVEEVADQPQQGADDAGCRPHPEDPSRSRGLGCQHVSLRSGSEPMAWASQPRRISAMSTATDSRVDGRRFLSARVEAASGEGCRPAGIGPTCPPRRARSRRFPARGCMRCVAAGTGHQSVGCRLPV